MKKFSPLITIKEKTANSPTEFLELMTSESLETDEDVYALLQALNDEVL